MEFAVREMVIFHFDRTGLARSDDCRKIRAAFSLLGEESGKAALPR
jgi:hypothetical protein